MRKPGWVPWAQLNYLYGGFIEWQEKQGRSLDVRFIRLWPFWRTDKHWRPARYSMWLVRDRKTSPPGSR
jgi:hypothetical protein